jgi:hypothetical protein
MTASQNGWRANDKTVVSSRVVPGTQTKLTVRNGAPGDLLLEVAALYNRTVENIDGTGDNWGYAERNIRGSATTVSNHASGTAIDLRATRHPLGTDPRSNFTAAQIDAINRIIAAAGGMVRWGGSYTGRKDGMHFELADGSTEQQCATALTRIRATGGMSPTPAPVQSSAPTLQLGSTGESVKELQRVLSAWYPTLKLSIDGVFGPATMSAVKYLQTKAGLTADGIVGPKTRAVLHL